MERNPHFTEGKTEAPGSPGSQSRKMVRLGLGALGVAQTPASDGKNKERKNGFVSYPQGYRNLFRKLANLP